MSNAILQQQYFNKIMTVNFISGGTNTEKKNCVRKKLTTFIT